MALDQAALADLQKSGLSAETIKLAGISSLSVSTASKMVYGGDTDKRLKCNGVTMFPYHDIEGKLTANTRFKLHGAEKDYGKYRSPVGQPLDIYIPVGFKALAEDRNDVTVIITEGEKKVTKATQEGIPCLGVAGIDCWFDPVARDEAKRRDPTARLAFNTPVHPVIADIIGSFDITKIVVLGDSDCGGTSEADLKRRRRIEIFAEALRYQFTNTQVALTTCPPEAGKKAGLDDWLCSNAVTDVIATLEAAQVATTTQTVALDLGNLLSMNFPPRELLIGGWLAKRNIGMIYAARGAGKTLFSIECAVALITNSNVFGWPTGTPVGVLYIDGEMSAAEMQSRFTAALVRANTEAVAPLRIINPELSPKTPNLASEAGQKDVDRILQENPNLKVIVIDNISTLCSNDSSENDAESWTAIQTWAVNLRARGYTIIFIHHAGKSGQQRGTSRREDVMDFVINLKLPEDYDPSEGARFEAHFEKHRAFSGEAAEAKVIELSDNQWNVSAVESTYSQVIALAQNGMKQADIAKDLNLNRSSVSRILTKAVKKGDFNDGL